MSKNIYFDKNTTVFHDGSFVKCGETSTNLYSQSLHYGNGVFDAMRSYNTPLGTHIFKAREHYERFLVAADKMLIDVPYTVSELINITYNLLEINNLTNAYIRPLLYTGVNMELTPSDDVHLFIAAWHWEKYQGKDLLDVMISSFCRPSPKSCFIEAKISGHYVNSYMATVEAKKHGYDDALMLDINGHVAEGAAANFFMEKNGKLYTPKRGHILPGITRATIFEIATTLGIVVVEKDILPEELWTADGAFFCGTAYEIAGINTLNGKAFQKPWNKTLGSLIFTKFGQRVTQNEYDNYSII